MAILEPDRQTGFVDAHIDDPGQPIEGRKYALIVDNVALWREHIAHVTREACPDLEIVFAASTSEALAVIETIRARHEEVSLVLTDLHMSQNPDENGQALIAQLATIDNAPAMAIVSGTLADPVRMDLAATTGLPILDKDAFWPSRSDTDSVRQQVIKRICGLADSGRSSGIDIAALNQYAARDARRLAEVSANRVFIDEVKAGVVHFVAKYKEFLGRCDEGLISFLMEPDLYDETGIKLHEFKNHLSNLLREFASRNDLPEGLTVNLAAIQVWINNFLRRSPESQQTTDVVALTDAVCSNFKVFRAFSDRIKFDSTIEHLNVAVDRDSFARMLIEMIQNALVHSRGQVKVVIDHKLRRLEVVSSDSEPLGFFIQGGERYEEQATEEESPEKPASSSKGLDFLIAESTKQNLRFSLLDIGGGQVAAGLEWSQDDSGYDDYLTVAQELEEGIETLVQMPNVIFICHDGRANDTFKHLLENKVSGYRYLILSMPAWEQEKFLEARKLLLQNAALVVVHMDLRGYGDYLTPLRRTSPHLSFLPASLVPSTLRVEKSLRDLELYEDEDKEGVLNVIRPEHIEEYLATQSPDGTVDQDRLNDLRWGLYKKDYEPEDWKLLLEVAQYMSKKRLGNISK